VLPTADLIEFVDECPNFLCLFLEGSVCDTVDDGDFIDFRCSLEE